jgi:hypothetical protein
MEMMMNRSWQVAGPINILALHLQITFPALTSKDAFKQLATLLVII